MKQRFDGAHLQAWGLLSCPEWRVGQQVIFLHLGQLRRALNSCGYGECQSTAPSGGWGTCIFACTLKCRLAGFGENIQCCLASISCSWLFSGSVVRGVGDTVIWPVVKLARLLLMGALSLAHLVPYIQHH